MPQLIRSFDNQNRPIVSGNPATPLIHFNLIRLSKHERHESAIPGYELVFVVLQGRCNITVDGCSFESVGKRKDIWSGDADSVYTGPGGRVSITALEDQTEIAVAGGACETDHAPFRIQPEDVDIVDVGSVETHSRRQIHHILGNRHANKAGRLLVSELYCDDGCWSGYPPHKHDADALPEETCHEELYHYRFHPANGFGCQISYQADGASEAWMTRHGDTVLIDRGYHPTVTSPGHREYILTILAGRAHRSLVQNFHEEHRHLMGRIPGIDAMRARFR